MRYLLQEKHIEQDISALIETAIKERDEKRIKTYSIVEEVPTGQGLKWWDTQPEQVARINAGAREAIDAFYFENYKKIVYSGWAFLRKNAYLRSVISHEDLMQQVYFDLRTGVLKLRPFDKAITRAVYTSFRFAAVGGLDEIYIYEDKKGRKKCQN